MRSPAQAFWLSYFMLSLAVIGALFAFVAGSPFYLIGRIYRPAHELADRILTAGVRTLLAAQPWFNARVDLPSRPGRVLIVSNHRSHLDAFILLSRISGIRILAKEPLFRIPFLGTMMRLMEQIPVRSGRMDAYVEAMEKVRSKLKRGETVHVFPELTRCEPGLAGVQRFSLLPFQIAIQEDVTLLPVVFKGTDSAWGRGARGIRFRTPIEARALEPIEAGGFSSAQELKNAVQTRIEAALV